MLRRREVIEAQPFVEHRRFHPDGFAQLKKPWLGREAGCGRFVIPRGDVRNGLSVRRSHINEAAIHFANGREIERAECAFREQRIDEVASSDRLAHAERRLVLLRRFRAQAEEKHRVQRRCLHVAVDDRIRVNDDGVGRRPGSRADRHDDGLGDGCQDRLEIHAGAPRAARSRNDVGVHADVVVLVVEVCDERRTKSKTVLRRKVSNRKVDRMIGEEFDRTLHQR